MERTGAPSPMNRDGDRTPWENNEVPRGVGPNLQAGFNPRQSAGWSQGGGGVSQVTMPCSVRNAQGSLCPSRPETTMSSPVSKLPSEPAERSS